MTGRLTFSLAAILAAIIGLAASIWAYSSPETGVNDTAGPLLTALGHGGMAVLALLLLVTATARGAGIALFLLAALGTCLAGYLLQQPLILGPAIVALIALPLGHMIGDAR